MADNSFRTFRRDGPARDTGSSPRNTVSDPLAELARLIGQSDSHRSLGRNADRAAESYDDGPAPAALDWGAAEEDYAQPSNPDESDSPRLSDSYQSQSDDDAAWQGEHDDDEEPAEARRYARAPAHDPRGGARRNADINAEMQESRYRDERQPRKNSRADPLPYIPPVQDEYLSDDGDGDVEDHDGAQHDHEAPPARRSGTLVIVAVLGLAVLGTAGAVGYRAMFGGSVIPSLPPIIKPGDSPIKIVPQHESQNGTANQTDADAKDTGDQLVTHEEQPVNIQAATPGPRVVTTIPVISNAPDAPLPDAQSPSASASAPDAPMAPPPASGEADNNPGQPFGPPPDQVTGSTAAAPNPEARPVHTLTILPQQEAAAADAAAPPAPARVRQSTVRPPRQPAERTASAGPLSIVPTAEGEVPPRTRSATRGMGSVALASPGEQPAEAAPERSGGYAVQVTSQRSEAEAQAAFRSLQAKYPQQLGDRQAFVRRADLGAKGIYYRALVGPFASSQEAVSLCSSLKSAGGNCLIQRN